MGIVNFGVPKDLVLLLKETYKVDTFVETGTYYGGTATWAAEHFNQVITIELSQQLYDSTTADFGNIPNIEFVFGDSRAELGHIVQRLETPSLFWLDGHWSGNITYGEHDQCPLLDEISIINRANHKENFILIDDARLFLSPPPEPLTIEAWPTIYEVTKTIKAGDPDAYIVVIDDVIIAVPDYAKELVAKYCQEVNTKWWNERGERLKESKIKQGLRSIHDGLYSIRRGLTGK